MTFETSSTSLPADSDSRLLALESKINELFEIAKLGHRTARAKKLSHEAAEASEKAREDWERELGIMADTRPTTLIGLKAKARIFNGPSVHMLLEHDPHWRETVLTASIYEDIEAMEIDER